MRSKRSQLSIRAASWIAAQCVRRACAESDLFDERIDAFCVHLEQLAKSANIPAWDKAGADLVVTGLGDALPSDLCHVQGLFDLVESARELSTGQIYSAWSPDVMNQRMRRVLSLSRLEAASLPRVFFLHCPGSDGWGRPVEEQMLEQWREAISGVR